MPTFSDSLPSRTSVALAALGLLLTITPATATADTPDTACADQVRETSGFTPVLGLDLPSESDWLNQPVPYDFDRTAEVAGGFDRVGYCLELDGPEGPKWVWTSMEAFTDDATRLGLPTMSGQIVRQRVDDLDVRTNVPGVNVGGGQTGYLEMWPNQYSAGASTQVANASSQVYDADDNITGNTQGYGSFQVHQIGATRPSELHPKTVLAVNTFTSADDAALSVGIGTNTAGEPDWTFANNANSFTQRRLTVYARPAPATVTEGPRDRQLYPRDAQGGASVPVSGTVLDPRVRTLRLEVTSGRSTRTHTARVRDGQFSFSPRITAGLHSYKLSLWTVGAVERRVAHWTDIVSGDVYVVQGQSNAQAARYVGNAAGEESPWLRSFGSSTPDPVISGADRAWHHATGDVSYQSGSIGQWAIRTGRRIVDTYKVPVALVNGAHGGQPIAFFQRDDADPDRITTNYGRLRQRLAAAGIADRVRGVFFYQGESDSDNAAVHVGGYSSLLADWRADLGAAIPGGSQYLTYQVRTSPCNNGTAIALRDAQRRLGDTHDVTVLSTNGLSGHDGCHYAYAGGYRELGDHAFAVLARDQYRGPSAGVAPPNPRDAAFTDQARTEITVQLRSTDPLTVDPGAEADFRIDGSTATVSAVEYQAGGRLVLTLSEPAPDATGVTYLGHLRAGPWITNATGVGMLAFTGITVG
ncbi:sialate O-acetylesterase [Actinophytocola xinjiangensis]|uniref:sialate O-acetylesterase n=1 Tax=Actinophytocola xinjiangensis TaxID=485602 RepID=UPI0009FEFBE0|nr:sialate O-acetylesterase [Actinophytocola xinjiangensis]